MHRRGGAIENRPRAEIEAVQNETLQRRAESVSGVGEGESQGVVLLYQAEVLYYKQLNHDC